MDIAERHRLSIDRWFYPCNPQMHSGLADMWEADRRFADNIDKYGAGLTEYLAAAVRANAKRTLCLNSGRSSCRSPGGRTKVAIPECGGQEVARETRGYRRRW